jgi:hypothetical protein
MRSQDQESLGIAAVKHEHGWAPTVTLYSPSAVPLLSRSPPMCTRSTTSAPSDASTAAALGQEKRVSADAKREQMKDNRNRRWMKQRDLRRARDSRAVCPATEESAAAGEQMNSVKRKGIELETATPISKDARAEPDKTRRSAADLLSQILTTSADEPSPSSLESGPSGEPVPTNPRMSVFSVMQSDPRTHDGYYKHDENYW